jgi:ribosomal protein S18 acetylase RimI-like enzyme
MEILKQEEIKGFHVRFTEPEDAGYLKEWFLDPSVKRSFPMDDEIEVDDSVMRMMSFMRYGASLTATYEGIPVGMAMLYLQPYKRLAHQCEFGIIVDHRQRSKGFGAHLLNHLIALAKDNFNIEVLHLQVYQDNPAINLYKRFGFEEFGRQACWIKEASGENVGRIFMEKYLS